MYKNRKGTRNRRLVSKVEGEFAFRYIKYKILIGSPSIYAK